MKNIEADALAFDLPFAKVVNTPEGEALLIGGNVFHIVGPDGNAADVMSIAMRRATRGESSSMGAEGCTAGETGGTA